MSDDDFAKAKKQRNLKLEQLGVLIAQLTEMSVALKASQSTLETLRVKFMTELPAEATAITSGVVPPPPAKVASGPVASPIGAAAVSAPAPAPALASAPASASATVLVSAPAPTLAPATTAIASPGARVAAETKEVKKEYKFGDTVYLQDVAVKTEDKEAKLDRLRVATWNVTFLTDKKKANKGWLSRLSLRKTATATETFAASEAKRKELFKTNLALLLQYTDVLCLQDLNIEWVTGVFEQEDVEIGGDKYTNVYYSVLGNVDVHCIVYVVDAETGICDAILWRTNVLRAKSYKFFYLNSDDSRSMIVQFESRANGRSIQVANVQLDDKVHDVQLSQLRKCLVALGREKTANSLQLLCGTLNFSPINYGDELLEKAHYKSVLANVLKADPSNAAISTVQEKVESGTSQAVRIADDIYYNNAPGGRGTENPLPEVGLVSFDTPADAVEDKLPGFLAKNQVRWWPYTKFMGDLPNDKWCSSHIPVIATLSV